MGKTCGSPLCTRVALVVPLVSATAGSTGQCSTRGRSGSPSGRSHPRSIPARGGHGLGAADPEHHGPLVVLRGKNLRPISKCQACTVSGGGTYTHPASATTGAGPTATGDGARLRQPVEGASLTRAGLRPTPTSLRDQRRSRLQRGGSGAAACLRDRVGREALSESTPPGEPSSKPQALVAGPARRQRLRPVPRDGRALAKQAGPSPSTSSRTAAFRFVPSAG